MTNVKADPSNTHHWKKLTELHDKHQSQSIEQLNDLAANSGQCIDAAGLSVDLSRNFVNQAILDELVALAKKQGISEKISQLIAGEAVNNTEARAAHHSALRLPDSIQTRPEVSATQQKIKTLADSLRNKTWRGSGNTEITDVINIGIGGSDLGPRMVCNALSSLASEGPRVHFVANIDPRDLETTLQGLKPASTLILISSKSFNTTETLENALSARRWLLEEIEQSDLSKHVIAVSSNVEKAVAFGVDADNILPMWDWVGGRYSLWSAIGLPIAIAIGYSGFNELLKGAHAMDKHFATAPIESNLPSLLALLEVWYVNFCAAHSSAVLPYSHELGLFPDYLQQLTMESNGKQVHKDGSPVTHRTCPTIWGSAGTIGQHSFHQLLHQGTELIPVDFILPLHSHSDEQNKQAHLVANCLAQSKALTEGKNEAAAELELADSGLSESEVSALASHKASPGNRPNTIIAMDKLTPSNLGALVALYEHKVYAASVVWDINSFDQWGVELGKQLSTPIYAALTGDSSASTDKTTAFWIKRFTQS
ncbi:MAG: glucose-6-phosphate isomerase [Pseudomonadales bacterium]|nr:glucose-6-phosphate isomerase [Pseudomonadales bacterium]